MLKKTMLLAGVLLLFYQSIYSQDVFIQTDSTTVPKVNLEEVVINASKNNSQLKELPVSVTIIPSSVIETNNIETLNQVSSFVPNFSMPDYGSKLTSPVYIRGVGSRINAPSVGLYVDNVPFFEKAAFDFDFFDIESIEILRGPQGTLFGRNSMGGLINIMTKSPSQYQGSHLKLSAGTYGVYKFNFGYFDKANDKFAYSLSGNYQHNNGFYTNHFRNKMVDNLESFGLRNRLIYKTSEKVEIENIVSFDNSEQGGYPYAVFNVEEGENGKINYNQTSSYNRMLFSDALKLKYSSVGWELSNTLSYQYLDDAQKIDQDFTISRLFFVRQYQKQHMISNEVIFRTISNSRLRWLFGVFGFLQYSDSDVDVDSYSNKVWYLKSYGLDTKGIAVFNQLNLKIARNLSFTGGVRFDYEEAELAYTYISTMAGLDLPGQDTIFPKLKDHVFLPRVAINYLLNKTNLYASYSSGYKPGGYNSTFEKPEHLMFKNETSHNFEIGVKTPLLSNLFFTELAFFYTQLKDQQIYRTVPSGRGSYLDNSGLSENKGVEVTLKTRPHHGFEGMISYGYTHSEIKDYKVNNEVNYNNKYTPYIPRHTMAMQLTKNIILRNNTWFENLRLNALYQQTGKLYWNLSNSLNEERYGVLNANVSFIKNNLQFEIWGKNLTNSRFNSFMFEALGNVYAQENKPMTIGASISVKF